MLHGLFCMFMLASWTMILFPFAAGSLLFSPSGAWSLWICRKVWSPVLMWSGGARLDVRGLEHVDAERPTIYVSNHQSTLDIPALFMAIPVNLRYVAKKMLKAVPFLGWYLHLAGFIFIDRARHRDALRSLEEAGAQIRSGKSIIMFAEGTRSDDGSVLPFKKGPFALAEQARVAVCPVAIAGSGVIMPKNSWKFTPGVVRVAIGAPIDPVPFGDDREALLRAVRNAIIELHLSIGGQGGDKSNAIAAKGREGISQRDVPGSSVSP